MSRVSRLLLHSTRVCLVRQPIVTCRRSFIASSNRFQTQEAVSEISPPQLDNEPKLYEPKIVQLVDEISKLTLREVTDLNELLKSTLGIKDAPVMAAASIVAPQAEDAEGNNEEDQGVVEQSEFTVKLTSYNATSKIKVIKAIKLILPELNLVQVKKFVESAPCVLKEEVSKEESEQIKADLTAAGAQVEVV
uniref:39S ribosomal protein L12, mitochondrial-like n=1 Tax=Phallusia mammillata TaxID=59560 RepID=A0A6F9DLU3_9ASCI|nr:39S ribosomal protein L12, mitochondrial-like [Phallusia mammillata]